MSGHLRVVSSPEGPKETRLLGTFTFARVGAELVVLHDDGRRSVPDALEAILAICVPALIAMACPEKHQQVQLGSVLPGSMGGFDLRDAVPASEGALAELTRSQPNFSQSGRG